MLADNLERIESTTDSVIVSVPELWLNCAFFEIVFVEAGLG
jgi:hypothetical protein